MLEAIRRGDRIVTGGGVIGTVTKVVNEAELQVEIADGVKVRVQRGMVASVLTKTEPAPAKADGDAANEDGAAEAGEGGDVAKPADTGAGSKLKSLFGGKK